METAALIAMNNPLIGVGISQYAYHAPEFDQYAQSSREIANNVYLEIASELGVINLFLFRALLETSPPPTSRVSRQHYCLDFNP